MLPEKVILSGNEGVALGARDAGVGFATGYPGTPSTEINEYLIRLGGPEVAWAVNEKVALEKAYGASIAGLRSLVTMKHVGLNVAADPLFTCAYMGVNGGMVVVTADDPFMHSSQNEQDNRWYALHAKVPMLEPSDSEECRTMTRTAFELSERHDLLFLLRLVTRVCHSRSLVSAETSPGYARVNRGYKRDIKFVVLPVLCRQRRLALDKNLEGLMLDPEALALNRIEITGSEIGIITAGASYNYVKEAYGDRYSILKLGLVWPLDPGIINRFASQVARLYVVEELDPFLEMQIRAMGIVCEGKRYLPSILELNPQLVATSLKPAGLEPLEEVDPASESPVEDIPARPPLFCAGCPHRGFFHLARKEKLTVVGDIGCYTLGATPPLQAIHACACMGGGFSIALGMSLNLPDGDKVFGVLGDSTFYHSGMTGAVESIFNQDRIVPVVLDNRITAMTGHQQNPGTGAMMNGQPTFMQEPAKIFKAVGYDRVLEVDAFDLQGILEAIRDARSSPDMVAMVVKAPCRLIRGVQRGALRTVDQDQCKQCKNCLKLGCPALYLGNDGFPAVDPEICAGCGVCEQECRNQALSAEVK